MPDFFASSRLLRRPARTATLLITLLAAGSASAWAEETNPLRAVTNAIGLTAPTSDRPDFIRQSRPDEEKMDFVPFLAPEKKRIPVKTPAQAAADDADLVAAKNQAQARLKKLQSESVEQLAPAPKPPAVQDKF
ncbi:hypothetical protein GJ654_08260 [Rhodoblastus acidophilus]|jgi:hypothetical protein|uniref:DUF3035 domain-containing protein n=1 Tax=Rhodoblastus acidophilus TaxID=1074 RepID=A0A6N8DKS1_RHOAC|nr:hypothetical protein [Rhodoblastus acidophilus]MCW2273868.1 hypothetical protein [Rhodoblastus acidophilus]MTV30987.1 hypothetical protein [Rhodoblastus acidophilus]